jgi:PAS domain S-box-containing protein
VEEARRASEARYRALFEHAPDGILIADSAGRYLDANASICRMLGYARDELIGLRSSDVVAPADAEYIERTLTTVKHNSDHHQEWELRRKDGSVLGVEVMATNMPDGNILAMVRDITERKLAEEALRETNRHLEETLVDLHVKKDELARTTQQLWQASKLATMGELAASIAHELNNPLATVSLRTETLLMQIPADADQRKPLEIIAREVDRMASLVDNLLQFTRRSTRQVSTVDVRQEIENTVELVHYHLRSRNIEVIQDFDEPLPTVQADRQQLCQLFLNLLTNASDAMPQGGRLTMRATSRAPEGGVAIDFADSGEGITPENLEKVWEPFFTTKPEGKGTGLGLAICRRIVEEHGGTMNIISQIGEGTTVRMILPATHSQSAHPPVETPM